MPLPPYLRTAREHARHFARGTIARRALQRILRRRALALALPLAVLAPLPLHAQAPLGLGGLRVEYLTNPLAMDAARPRLSWRLESGVRGTMQAAYQLQVAGSVHVPHRATVRSFPQLSLALTVPHFFSSRVQNSALVSDLQAQ